MRTSVLLPLVALSAALGGCVVEPRPYHRSYERVPAPQRMTEIIVYPARGQSAEQLDRDRYECHNWAVRQTGFDPSQQGLAPAERVRVVDQPPAGAGVVAGAITGAVLGAIIAPHGGEGGGAAIGALAGGIMGGAAEQAHAEETHAQQDRYGGQYAYGRGDYSERSGTYRRAISACLEGRGYTVK